MHFELSCFVSPRRRPGLRFVFLVALLCLLFGSAASVGKESDATSTQQAPAQASTNNAEKDISDQDIQAPIVADPALIEQKSSAKTTTTSAASVSSSSSSSSSAASLSSPASEPSVSVLEVASATAASTDSQSGARSKSLQRLKDQTATAGAMAAASEGISVASLKEKTIAQSVLSRVSQAFLTSSLEKIAREKDEAEIRQQVEEQDKDWNELSQDDMIALELSSYDYVPNFDFHPSHTHLLPFSHTTADNNKFPSLASSTSPLTQQNTLNTNMMQLEELIRSEDQQQPFVLSSAIAATPPVPPPAATPPFATPPVVPIGAAFPPPAPNPNSLNGFHRDGWTPARQRTLKAKRKPAKKSLKRKKPVRRGAKRPVNKGAKKAKRGAPKSKPSIGLHHIGVAPIVGSHSGIHMRLMQRPAWYVSHQASPARHSTFTSSSHAHRPDSLVNAAQPHPQQQQHSAQPRFSQLLAQTDNQFTLFSKEQNAIQNLAKAKAALAAIQSKTHSTVAAKAKAAKLTIRKAINRNKKGFPVKRKSLPRQPAAEERPRFLETDSAERRKEEKELQQAGQLQSAPHASIHDVSAQYADGARFMERNTASTSDQADAGAGTGAEMRMRQRMFGSSRLFTQKAKTHRVDLTLAQAAQAGVQGPKPSEIEDCTGCKFIWMQVEMDVGGARFVEDVQASFEHNCMDAQKSTIFYGVCEDMYDDMYAMTDDYMANTFPVDAICKRAKMCK